MAAYRIAQYVLPGKAHTGFGVFEESMIDLRELGSHFLLGAQFQLAHQYPVAQCNQQRDQSGAGKCDLKREARCEAEWLQGRASST